MKNILIILLMLVYPSIAFALIGNISNVIFNDIKESKRAIFAFGGQNNNLGYVCAVNRTRPMNYGNWSCAPAERINTIQTAAMYEEDKNVIAVVVGSGGQISELTIAGVQDYKPIKITGYTNVRLIKNFKKAYKLIFDVTAKKFLLLYETSSEENKILVIDCFSRVIEYPNLSQDVTDIAYIPGIDEKDGRILVKDLNDKMYLFNYSNLGVKMLGGYQPVVGQCQICTIGQQIIPAGNWMFYINHLLKRPKSDTTYSWEFQTTLYELNQFDNSMLPLKNFGATSRDIVDAADFPPIVAPAYLAANDKNPVMLNSFFDSYNYNTRAPDNFLRSYSTLDSHSKDYYMNSINITEERLAGIIFDYAVQTPGDTTVSELFVGKGNKLLEFKFLDDLASPPAQIKYY